MMMTMATYYVYNMTMLKVDNTDDGTDTKEYAGGLKGYYGVSWE